MSDPKIKNDETKKARTRSPNYPYVDLEEALDKAKTLYEAEKRNAVPLSSAAKHWNYTEKSSGLKLTIAALKKYGFLAEAGSGYVKVSDAAFKIIVDERPDSNERVAALQEAALSPELYRQLWEKYGTDLPSDASLRHYLLVELEFNDRIVDSVIKKYKNTISFANLKEPVIKPEVELDAHEVSSQMTQAKMINTQEIPVFLDVGKTVKIPYPLTEEDYVLLLEQLKLLKNRIVKKNETREGDN